MVIEACLAILDVADKATRLYDWFTGARFGAAADSALDTRRRDDPDLIKVSEHVFVDRRIRELVTAPGSAELIDPRIMRELIDPVASAIRGTVLTSQIIETPTRLRDVFRRNPWDLLHDIRPVHYALPDTRSDWVPVAFWEEGVEYVGYQKRGAMEVFGFDFAPVTGVLPTSLGSSGGSTSSPATADPGKAINGAPGARAGARSYLPTVPHFGPTPNELRAELTKVFGFCLGAKGVFFGGQLTKQRIAALRGHFQPLAGEHLLGFFDTSLFGDASIALVFTTSRIAVLDRSWTHLNKEGSVTYLDLLSCPLSVSFPGKVNFSNTMSFVPNASVVPAAEMEKALVQLQFLLRPYFSRDSAKWVKNFTASR